MRSYKPYLPFLIGLFAGAFLSAASARAQAEEPGVLALAPSPAADAMLGKMAWKVMSEEQRRFVELVARDAARSLEGEAFEALPDRRKAALRGYAMRALGVDDAAIRRGVI